MPVAPSSKRLTLAKSASASGTLTTTIGKRGVLTRRLLPRRGARVQQKCCASWPVGLRPGAMMWRSGVGVGAVLLALSGCKGHPSAVAPSATPGEAGEAPVAQIVDAMPEGSAAGAATIKI